MPLLELDDVHTYYGAIHALRGVTLNVEEGEIVTLIGSNGAGKSTTLRTISGQLKPRQGTVKLRGERIDHRPAHEIVQLGVCQSPEGRRVFSRMSVHENLEMGAFSRPDDKAAINADFERVYGLFPRLKERESQKAGTLSGGEQQMLAMGRALMAEPKVLLLDEPSMGLAPILVEQIFEIITTRSRARPSCLSNRTLSWRWPSPIVATSFRLARSCSRTSHPPSPRTRPSGALISAGTDLRRHG